MRQGTTPTIAVKTSQNLSDYARVVLSIKSVLTRIDLEKDRLEFTDEGFTFSLTQAETLALKGTCEVQVRAVTRDGYAVASSIASASFDRILKDGELDVSGGDA